MDLLQALGDLVRWLSILVSAVSLAGVASTLSALWRDLQSGRDPAARSAGAPTPSWAG